MSILIHAADRGRREALPVRFVEGGVTFLVDRSVAVVPGYEWIDDNTVRIHPDAVEAMYAHMAS